MYCELKDGGRLAYEVHGTGAPILLLRPLGGSRTSWDGFSALLAHHLQVIVFDQRGTGEASDPPRNWTTRGMAGDALALLDHLGISRCHVYGISMGGMVASWLAIDAPQRVDHLVLASTLTRGFDVRPSSLGRLLALAQCLTRGTSEVDECIATRVLSAAFRQQYPERVERIRALSRARATTRGNILKFVIAVTRHDVRRHLQRIGAPTLLLIGVRDAVLTCSSQQATLRAIPCAQLQVVHDAGHDVSVEAPEQTANRVLAFVRSS